MLQTYNWESQREFSFISNFGPFFSKFTIRKQPNLLQMLNFWRAISQSIFNRFSNAWHHFDQRKELFEMSIGLVHYTFYLKSWVFESNNLSRPMPLPIWVRGPKIPSKVSETNVGTWSIVILEIIFANDNTWLPPLKYHDHIAHSRCFLTVPNMTTFEESKSK